MKKLLLGMATLAALTFSVASSALTLGDFNPGATLADAALSDTGAQYVTLADTANDSVFMITTGAAPLPTGSGDFVLGIFDPVTGDKLNVLDSKGIVPGSNALATITFDKIAGNAASQIDSGAMGTTFGFFIQFYAGAVLSTDANDIYFSDAAADIFSIFYDSGAPIGSAMVSDVGLGIDFSGHDPAWRTLVGVQDVAPVPLPAAAWLFGSALLGLLGLGRRRQTATGVPA